MPEAADFEGAGLLEGLEGEQRAARLRLLEHLREVGFELVQLQEAASEERLVMLPLENALAGSERYTPNEIAERTGVDRELLDEQWRALGMAVGDPDEPSQTADELAAAERVKEFLGAGLDPEAMRETARVMAMAMSQIVAANRQMVGELFAAPDVDAAAGEEAEPEDVVAARLEALGGALVPMVGPTLEHIYKLHLREQLRVATLGQGTAAEGEEIAVAFADLVGFTKLGEQLPPEQFGRITARFGELAADVATADTVRLVKLIGDAAMLASPNPEALLGATLDLVEAVEEEGGGFPGLRAGVSFGQVLPRSGDLYGRAVNLASRLTATAHPGSVLVSAEIQERLEGEFRFSDAGHKSLKGIDGGVRVYRARDLDDEAEAQADSGDRSRRPLRRRRKRRRRR
ncbi:MAG TPA: adenylate cyclase regulatory domain-containing protein [Solirubrobacterales bacterium]|nr:adenylate cyclase regulatory domain-containing protein [Solirubrobacterales bacterium]